nr:MAG TPA: hypothetical protein [Caudoviricetes sp.]
MLHIVSVTSSTLSIIPTIALLTYLSFTLNHLSQDTTLNTVNLLLI